MSLAALEAKYDLEALNDSNEMLVAVEEDGQIFWANRQWFEAAAEHGAERVAVDLGINYFSVAPSETARRLRRLLAESLETGRPFAYDYACPSPAHFYLFHLRGLPLQDRSALLSHSLRVVHARPSAVKGPDTSTYLHDGALLKMCANCRRLRRADGSAWDWVPDWVAAPPANVSHGLCDLCFGFEWGRTAATRIVVVAEEPALARALYRILVARGYDTVACTSTEDARRELLTGYADAVISDEAMPGGGVELIRWARGRIPRLSCSIVIGGNRPTALDADVLWLAKPFSPENLLPLLPQVS
jgi:CheY-like chemotaxis protein